jgi:GT2 family glycosyltransferase
MSTGKRILAIVVTHEGEYYIEKCLQSLTSNHTMIDVLVVDNDSADQTTAIVQEKFPSITLEKVDKNIGFGQANNIGFKKAIKESYDFVLLLNQDAWINPDTVSALLSDIGADQSNSNYGIYSPVQLEDEHQQWHSMLEFYFSGEELKQLKSNPGNNRISTIKMAPAAIWFIPVSCLEVIGGFDPIFFHYGEDDNLVDRLHYHGFKMGLVHHSLAYHDDSKLNKTYRKYYQRQRTFIIKQTLLKLMEGELDAPLDYLKKALVRRIVKQYLNMRWEDARDLRKIYRDLPKLMPQLLNSVSKSKQIGAFL